MNTVIAHSLRTVITFITTDTLMAGIRLQLMTWFMNGHITSQNAQARDVIYFFS